MRIADQLFKWLTLAVACGFLYLLWERRDIGRFTLHEHGTTLMIVDSKTGSLHGLAGAAGGVGWVEFNPFSGAAKVQIVDPAVK
jgi:hypothetical protein